MKICFILPNLLPVPNVNGGAIETIVTNLINENEKKAFFDITVVSIYNEKACNLSKEFNHTKIIYIKKNLIYVLFSSAYKFLNFIFKKNYSTYNEISLKKIKNMDFDYVIAEGGKYEGFKNYLKYFDKSKMILHVHHTASSNKIIDETFSKIITVSDFVNLKWKSSSSVNNVVTLRNCIDIENFNKNLNLSHFRRELGYNDSDIIVLFCGRIIEEKGLYELILSFKKINNMNKKLIIVGSINFGNDNGKIVNDYTNKIANAIEDIKDNVYLTGYVHYSEIYKYYRISDIFAVPSQWEEAAGLVNIEAMINSLPVVATNIGGIPEYLSEKCAFLIEKGPNFVDEFSSKMEYLMENADVRKSMGYEGKKIAENFTFEKYYENFKVILCKYRCDDGKE